MIFNLKTIRRLNVVIGGGLSGINNAPAPVSSELKILIRDVMDDMALGSEERSLIKVFIVNDFSMKHLGYPDKKFGVFLGVPQHFVLNRMSDFDVIPLVENTNLSPDSPEAWNFKHALSLSKEAKKFALASEIYEAKHLSFYYFGLLPLFVLLQGNAISFFSEKLLKILRKSFPLFHAFVFLLATGFYILLNDLINIYTQAEADYLTAALGTSYIEGGIEYYEKILQRNKAMKKLDRSAPYTEAGELKIYMGFRTHSMPFERRIMLLKDLKSNYKFSKQEHNPLKYI